MRRFTIRTILSVGLCGALLATLYIPVDTFAESSGRSAESLELSSETSKSLAINIICFGDSLTAGYNLDPEQAFPAQLEKILTERGEEKVRVVNAGVSGETSAGGLARVNWVLRGQVDIFLLALGANDGLRGIDPKVTKQNLLGIIDAVRKKYPATQIVLAGMEIPVNMGEDYRSRFRAIFREIADERNVPLIPFLLEGVGGRPELNLPDGIHPNAKGQKIVAETVAKSLLPLL